MMIESMAHPQSQLEYNAIVDGIYIGTNQCCQMDFDRLLKEKEGITADISLEKDRLDAPFGVEFYLWLPVEDHLAPTPAQFELGVSTLEKLVALGQKTYVHCKNGHGRAPTLVAAYLIRKKGLSVKDAISFLKTHRPPTHLAAAQEEALIQFQKMI